MIECITFRDGDEIQLEKKSKGKQTRFMFDFECAEENMGKITMRENVLVEIPAKYFGQARIQLYWCLCENADALVKKTKPGILRLACIHRKGTVNGE